MKESFLNMQQDMTDKLSERSLVTPPSCIRNTTCYAGSSVEL